MFKIPSLAEFLSNSKHAASFLRNTLLLTAIAGLVLLVYLRSIQLLPLKAWLIFLTASTLITLLNSEIASLWPWASRRLIEFTVPLVAIAVGFILSNPWDMTGRRAIFARTGSVIIGTILLLNVAKPAWHAWTFTEFDGLSKVLASAASEIGPDDIVVVDHFRWATPLRFIYEQPVVNGELFFADKSPDRMREALKILQRLHDEEGKRIRFLTSTEQGLAVFPLPIEPAVEDWSSEQIVLKEIIHSPKAMGFQLKNNPRVFRLYTWE